MYVWNEITKPCKIAVHKPRIYFKNVLVMVASDQDPEQRTELIDLTLVNGAVTQET